MRNPYKYCRSNGNESLNLAQGNLKRFDLFAKGFHGFYRCGFIGAKKTWREQSDVGGKMWQFGVKLAPQRFDKLSRRILHVSYERVTLPLRHEEKL